MDTELPLTVGGCGHFFEQDEYEMVRARGRHCPYILPILAEITGEI